MRQWASDRYSNLLSMNIQIQRKKDITQSRLILDFENVSFSSCQEKNVEKIDFQPDNSYSR